MSLETNPLEGAKSATSWRLSSSDFEGVWFWVGPNKVDKRRGGLRLRGKGPRKKRAAGIVTRRLQRTIQECQGVPQCSSERHDAHSSVSVSRFYLVPEGPPPRCFVNRVVLRLPLASAP